MRASLPLSGAEAEQGKEAGPAGWAWRVRTRGVRVVGCVTEACPEREKTFGMLGASDWMCCLS